VLLHLISPVKRFCLFLIAATLLSLAAAATLQAADVIEADVCVYGSTSGGVAAAVQAARMGKSVLIAEPGRHLGGMTSGGLSAVDIGDPRTVGGIAREYFTRLVASYGKTLEWDKPFESKGGGPATGGAYSIEPHVAEQVFNDMAREAKVAVHFNARLASVKKNGARITEFVTEDGTVFRAKVFIDATYEGDLMAKAGVSYTLQREGNAKYGERYNGIYYDEKYQPRTNHLKPGLTGRVKGGQGVWDRDFPLDPYVTPGDPASGLLPLVQAGEPGTPGDPAPGVQAYCFRLCLTTSAHRLPIAAPRGYDPKRYELVARFIEACQAIGDEMDLRWFSKHDALPNNKWDFNTATFGGNLPGASWEWPEATYARREKIAKEHENYHRGLLHFLATDERVPAKVRDGMKRFGLPRDEFTDNGGWPHQLYIREARRMVSDFVMTEHHTFGREVAPNSVGLGSYGTDTHEVRRIVKDGVVIREGKTAGGRDGAPPYPIGYGAIVPRASECENLFVTFALSASHMAFSSIRMEPVFMVTSQSAATAAVLAIDDSVSVQQVDQAKLRARLLHGQTGDRVACFFRSATRKRALNFMKTVLPSWLCLIALVAFASAGPLPTVDLSNDTARQVVIAQGTAEIYQGHPTTLLLPDGKTIFAVWTLGHGGTCGPMKRSNDGGLTWSELLPTPENWTQAKNCPSLYRLTDPQGVSRLFAFAGSGPDRKMQHAHSTDEGRTWTPMTSVGLECVMPFCTITPVDGGKRLIGLTSIRRPGEAKDTKSNIITQSESTDGGLTWSPWRVLLDLGELKPCEPAIVRSPDGKQLLCLLRENTRRIALFMTSDDEGLTWSAAKPLPAGLFGDRHMPHYAPDGRLVVCFRDTGAGSPTKSHFVAWVGRYEDIVAGHDGQYRIKLLHSYKGTDCGYPGLELLPDGTFVATTYIKYRPGPELNSVVSTRFQLTETDALAKNAPTAPASPAQTKVAGILLDDDAAELKGAWEVSAKQSPLVGESYRHDNRGARGEMTAKFAPNIPADGRYEVRLLYVANPNRASKVSITIQSADGEKTVFVNQKEECLVDGVPRALGTFAFKAGKQGAVIVSNVGASGFVNIDGAQFVPAELAEGERTIGAGAGFPTHPRAGEAPAPSRKSRPAPTTPRPPKSFEPVQPAKSATAAEVDGKSYDLVVIGGTPGGIACAVRAAREGLRVLLVNHTRHLGGFITSGAGGWEAPYDGLRSPLYAEMRTGAADYYRETYGEASQQHRASLPDPDSNAHIDRPKIEPRVAEMLFNQMVEREKTLAVLTGFYVESAERNGALLKSVTLRKTGVPPVRAGGPPARPTGGTPVFPDSRDGRLPECVRVMAKVFADGMYEGDLAAAAKVPYRTGREARAEYNEPHAGVIYTKERHKEPGQRGFPKDANEGRLKIRYNSHASAEIIEADGSGEADASVMAYNYRLILTRDPENRVMVSKPAGYDPAIVKQTAGGGFVPNLPNNKVAWNGGRQIGPQNGYPEADWPTRERISKGYLDGMLMLLWHLQNEAPEAERNKWKDYGLAADEFADNGHVPYEIYVREARRIVGRYVFTEHDNKVAAGLARTPIHGDSIAITDWPVDSVACLKRSVPGGHLDGIFFLGEETRPAQVPYRSLLPRGVDNLLVPVALSASHVGWGSIRLEPVWMQTGEAAGFAAALAVKNQTTPAELNPDLLLRALVGNRVMVSFFNDGDVASDEPCVPAVQYFGTKGFFHSYDARAGEPLKLATGKMWADAFARLKDGDPNEVARAVAAAEAGDSKPMTAAEFAALLPGASVKVDAAFTRGEALRLLFSMLP
jgi:flavin-dependent dehydrogenase